MTVVYPSGREVAQHEAHHAAALCLAGMVPKQVRSDWPEADLAGFVTVDWGDGPARDNAECFRRDVDRLVRVYRMAAASRRRWARRRAGAAATVAHLKRAV
jgi:hypothetical protein